MAMAARKPKGPEPLQLVKGLKPAPKAVRAQMDTIIVTQELAESWELPPFQRALKVNRKVQELGEDIKQTGVIPGVITLGKLDGKTYLCDGQHRREGFRISQIAEAYADVRICQFETLAEMADEFAQQNSRLVNMTVDDYLRALESSIPALMFIRQRCPYVGYGTVRQPQGRTVISMGILIRCWEAAGNESPTSRRPAMDIAKEMEEADAKEIIAFLQVAYAAWGRDVSSARLWAALNFTLCAWLWQNTVTGAFSAKATRFAPETFQKGLMSLAASAEYTDFLLGRRLCERDRAPCYSRIKNAFAGRMAHELPGQKIYFPMPEWAKGYSR